PCSPGNRAARGHGAVSSDLMTNPEAHPRWRLCDRQHHVWVCAPERLTSTRSLSGECPAAGILRRRHSPGSLNGRESEHWTYCQFKFLDDARATFLRSTVP